MAKETIEHDHPDRLAKYNYLEIAKKAFRIGESGQAFSERGHIVLCFNRVEARPIITCELYSKWYELFIWWTDGQLLKLPFNKLEDVAFEMGVSAFVDHVPNPTVVEAYAERHDYGIDELAHDLIKGRWHNEVSNETKLCDLCEGHGVVSIHAIQHEAVVDEGKISTCPECGGKTKVVV